MSYLLILSVTLEFVSRNYVFALGSIHGALFLIYLLLSLRTSHKQGWSLIVWLLIFFAAVVPFAFIAVELFLRKEMSAPEAKATT
jgi:integral membrane protein